MKISSIVAAVQFCAMSLFLVGCVETHSSDSGNMTIYPNVVGPIDDYRPLYTVNESKKVSAESKISCLFWFFTWGEDNAYADNVKAFSSHPLAVIFPFLDSKRNASRAAFYKACKYSNCDSIIAARYEVTEKNYFYIYKTMTVSVKGFPATLSGVEAVKPMPYYVDVEGKVVTLEHFVKPQCLFDLRSGSSKSSGGISYIKQLIPF